MTTSSPELAPRGMDFLYSRHRLNVATSRARCISVVVASPDLLRVRARTPEQMRLANAFCRFVEMARPTGRGLIGVEPATALAPISRRTQAARTRAQSSTSESGTCSSALWATRTSPGPKITHGVLADVDEQPHVGAVGLAEQRGAAAGDGLDGLGERRPAAGGRTRRAPSRTGRR